MELKLHKASLLKYDTKLSILIAMTLHFISLSIEQSIEGELYKARIKGGLFRLKKLIKLCNELNYITSGFYRELDCKITDITKLI